jgi:hypothetical protein
MCFCISSPGWTSSVCFTVPRYNEFTSLQAQSPSHTFNQVCWYLHGLATSKHVWLSLLTDLNRRLLLDLPLPETLLQNTVPELIAEVKRVVVGPTTWAANSAQLPTIRRQIRLPMHTNAPRYGSSTLLMGGRHLVSKHGRRFEIWNVTDGRREWSREEVTYIDAKPAYDDNELVVGLVTLVHHMRPPVCVLSPCVIARSFIRTAFKFLFQNY